MGTKTARSAEFYMTHSLDRRSLPSFAGYLATGAGTASMWMSKRTELAVTEHGMSETDALLDGARDRAQSLKSYLGKAAQTKTANTKKKDHGHKGSNI
jgi:hypothetical protein